MIERPELFLRQLFDRAVEVADPMRSLKDFLPEKPKGRVIVVGAGKASARMAEAVEAVWVLAKVSSSRAMAMAGRVAASRSSRRPIRFQTRRASRRRRVCWLLLKVPEKAISCWR